MDGLLCCTPLGSHAHIQSGESACDTFRAQVLTGHCQQVIARHAAPKPLIAALMVEGSYGGGWQ